MILSADYHGMPVWLLVIITLFAVVMFGWLFHDLFFGPDRPD